MQRVQKIIAAFDAAIDIAAIGAQLPTCASSPDAVEQGHDQRHAIRLEIENSRAAGMRPVVSRHLPLKIHAAASGSSGVTAP